MKPQARLRAARGVGHLPAITPSRQLPRQARRRVRRDIDRAGVDRLTANMRFVAPHAIDRIPAVFPVLAQQLEAQAVGRYRRALRIDRDHIDLGLGAFRNRVVAGGRAQPDRHRALPDRPAHSLVDRAPARLEHADPDRRGERAGQVRQIVQRHRQPRLAVLVGGRGFDITAIAGEFLADQAELETRMRREGILVERDDRLGLGRQAGARRAVIVAGVDIDRERLAGADRRVGGGERDLELRRHEILDAELGGADRRRFRVEPQFDPPRAKSRVARQCEALSIGAEPIPGRLPLLDLDAVRAATAAT